MTTRARLKNLRFRSGFEVVQNHEHSQAAQMTLEAGGAEGGPHNRHRGADQWLYVVAGRATAIVNGKSVSLKRGSLLFIARGSTHEIRNAGRTLLKTLNIYVPPAYTSDGEELPRGRS
jgi:mannose-6-phosphate isomerase-like protein (cupin superfamily)